MIVSQSSQIEFEKATKLTETKAQVKLKFRAKLIPQLNLEEVKAKIKGKSPGLIEDYLSSLPQFNRAEIVITPNLPKVLKTLPWVAKNISLEVKPVE